MLGTLRSVGLPAVLLACAPLALAAPDCAPVHANVRLPDRLVETSGVAFGQPGSGVYWTHNDGPSELFAVDSTGALLGSRDVGLRLRDWEDMAAAPCERHGNCLYLADTGDNAEQRQAGAAKIVRMVEPTPWDAESRTPAEVFPVRFPDGPRDVEAIFVLPGERIHLVTKGRSHPVTVYAYPPPLRSELVTLVEIQRLTGGPQPLANQVTGAAATRDGSSIAIRTYQSMAFYRMAGDTLQAVEGGFVNLRSLRESQGEGIALGPDGRVLLTSEGGPFGTPPAMNLLVCKG